MPQLPVAVIRTATQPQLTRAPQVETGAVAQGLGQLAETSRQIGREMQAESERQGRLINAKESTKVRVGLMREFERRRMSGEDLTGFSDWARTAAQTAFNDVIKNQSNPFARQYLELSAMEEVERFAIDGMRVESEFTVKKNIADMQEVLNGFKADAQLNPGRAAALAAEWDGLIEDAPMPIEFREEFKRGRSEILSMAIQSKMERAPGAALGDIDAALKNGLIDADTALRLRDRAQNEIDRAEARAAAAAAAADRQAAKIAAMTRDETAKEAFTLIENGTITPEWIEANRSNLDPSDYRIAIGALNDPTDQREVVADIYRRIYVEGEDVRESVLSDLEAGRISAGTAKSFLDENKSVLEDRGVQPAMQTARGYIRTQVEAIGKSTDDPALAQAIMGEAMLDLEEWRRANPDATDDQVIEQSKLIVRRRSITDYRRIAEQLERPAFLVGDVSNPDIDATQRATLDHFSRKHGGNVDAMQNDPEFQREAAAIERLRAAFEAAKSASEAR